MKLPLAILERARLKLDGVAVEDGMVAFVADPAPVDIEALVKGLDIEFWTTIAREHRAAIEKQSDLLAFDRAAARARFEEYLKEFGSDVRASRDDLFEVAEQENLLSLNERASAAYEAMRSITFVRHENTGYFLSTINPARPTVIAQAGADVGVVGEALDAVNSLLYWGEMIMEVLLGLATLMGCKIRRNIDMGKWVNRLALILRRNRRINRLLRRLARQGKLIGAWDILELLWALWEEGFTTDCLKEAAADLLDISFWGIIWLLGKLGSRFVPGVGQALLVADLGILTVELVRKATGHEG